jgi:hypothetical protein
MTNVSARFHQLSKTKLGLSPTPFALTLSGALPASAGARGAVARLRSVPGRAKGTHERGSCWWCSHPEAKINRPRPPLPYVANMSCGFWKSRSGCYICCKCFRGMLQAFVQNVSSVLDVRCKRFLSRCCTCFTPMLREYVQNVSAVSVLRCNKCYIWMLRMFHTLISIVCS